MAWLHKQSPAVPPSPSGVEKLPVHTVLVGEAFDLAARILALGRSVVIQGRNP